VERQLAECRSMVEEAGLWVSVSLHCNVVINTYRVFIHKPCRRVWWCSALVGGYYPKFYVVRRPCFLLQYFGLLGESRRWGRVLGEWG
jgi:hypothetical protein